MKDKRRSGRLRKLRKGDKKYHKINSLRDRKKSSKAIAADFAHSTGRQVHPSTVRRAPIRNGLHGRVAKRKPLLRKANKTKRLKFAQKHKNLNPFRWEKVLWCDESKFEMFGTKRRQYVKENWGRIERMLFAADN